VRVKGVNTAAASAPAPIEVAAFADVYATQYVGLVRLAYVTTGSLATAEDVVQEVFAELYRRFHDVDAPVPYLRRAVVSRCISWRRRQGLEFRRRHHAAVWLPDKVAPVGPEATAVRAALRRLRPRQRAAVFLRYYLDLPEAEIAEILGCRPGTVKSLLSRALVALREHFDDN
jgi:RNA polymerase sigma-70 factor (sigma-E family)